MGVTQFDESLDAWVFTDLFIDVIVKEDCQTHSLMDLDDLGSLTQLGLVDMNSLTDTLTHTQRLIDSIRYAGPGKRCAI